MTNQDKRTILIVDDTESNIDILLDLLGENYDILVALEAESAFSILEEECVDLILLDVMIPNINGFEACKILKSQTHTHDIPIIFITAKTDEDTIAEAFKLGGADFISKPFKPMELLARIRTQIKLKLLIDDLEYTTLHDTMNGVYNRRKVFQKGYAVFNKTQKNLYGVMIDIDEFKSVNVKYGHAFADEMIKSVSNNIENNMPKDALFGRVGGKEFAMLIHSNSHELVIKSLENIRNKIASLDFHTKKGESVKVTLSVGVAKKDHTTRTLDELLKSADHALYEAKGKGRNRTMFR